MATLNSEEIYSIVKESLRAVGTSKAAAEAVAETTCQAELRGISSHGLQMIPVYVERILEGGIQGNAEPTVSTGGDNIHIVDGNGCCGQLAAKRAMELVIEEVKKNRVSVVGVKNANHCGMLAYYTENISKEYSIAFMCTNTNPNVAAFGGAEKVLGTNPFSVALPWDKESIVIDMATTSIAKGKIYEYAMKGINIPEGYALDKDGKSTTDANEALNGTLLPFGGHKGYALSILVEILAGVITGGGFSKSVFSLHSDISKQQNVGMFLMGIPIEPLMEERVYKERIKEFVSIIKGSKLAVGSNEIYMPGEIEANRREDRLRNGIEVNDDIIEKLKQIINSKKIL